MGTQLDGQPAVHTDNAQTLRDAMNYLIDSGHRRIARVTGPTDLVHTRIRTEALWAEAVSAQITAVVVAGDYSEDSGRRLTGEILTSTPRPSAVVFDNDLMAVGGLAAADELVDAGISTTQAATQPFLVHRGTSGSPGGSARQLTPADTVVLS